MEFLAAALGSAAVLVVIGLSFHLGTRLVGRRALIVDARLQASVRALSSDGRVRIEPWSGPGPAGIALVVSGICDKLSLSREDADARPPGAIVDFSVPEGRIPPPWAPDLETDDAGFDARFRVLGPPPVVHAVLSDAARGSLLAMLQRDDVADVIAGNGELSVRVEGRSSGREGELKAIAVAGHRAIAEIQGRIVGAEPGQVSLAQSDAGQLSLADDRAGSVSLARGDEPRKP
jgi:hypothetical protein